MTPPQSSDTPAEASRQASDQGANSPDRVALRGGSRGRISARARQGGESGKRERSAGSVLFVVGLHIVVVVALAQWLTFGHGISWLKFPGGEDEHTERLTYVETPAPQQVAELPAARPTVSPRPTAPRLPVEPEPAAAPAGKPAGIATPAPVDTGRGAPPGVGVGLPDPEVRGVRPGYTDERVWRGMDGSGAGGSGAPDSRGDKAQGLDSIMARAIMASRDSVDSLARLQGRGGRAPGDWTTTDKSGNKWGWDQGGIRLGKVTIPNALLALLPLNSATAATMSGNMSRLDADRRMAASRADIQRMSERSLGEVEFKRVLSEMDKRRDTERRERLRAPSASLAAPVKTPERSGDK